MFQFGTNIALYVKCSKIRLYISLRGHFKQLCPPKRIKRGHLLFQKAHKLWQMRFCDNIAYVWGLGCHWDPLLLWTINHRSCTFSHPTWKYADKYNNSSPYNRPSNLDLYWLVKRLIWEIFLCDLSVTFKDQLMNLGSTDQWSNFIWQAFFWCFSGTRGFQKRTTQNWFEVQ